MASIDRLSDLPDDVICHILSFLPTNISARTSTLAKRWMFIWAHAPFLGFTCNGFCRECRGESTVGEQSINTFHIDSYDEFKLWISAIFARDVRDLVIRLNYKRALPRFLFNCKTLVDLSIFNSGFIRADGTKNLPVLKRLRLVNVGYESEESLPSLISGCPVLEELIVERMAMVCLDVISPTLIRLEADLDYVMVIGFVLPVLRYLRLRVGKALRILAVNLDSLTEADIHLSEGKGTFSSSVISFVRKLGNAKSLTLSTGVMNVPNKCFSIISNDVFHNLTELKLCGDWRFITSFLEIACNLRVITIRCLKVNDSIQNWMEPKQSSTCLISHLETVKLVDFEWSIEHEFDMVRYILRNAQVLKRMEIINTQPRENFDSNEKLEAFKKLESFERRSQDIVLENSIGNRPKKMALIDRLSGLPDDVICHILSFLPTNISLRTSTLAKRWMFVWAHAPFLGFTCNGFCRGCRGEAVGDYSKFAVVDRNINTFHIGSFDEFKLWISAIYARDVSDLVIRLNYQRALPRFLFSCKTLVDLSIFDSGFIRADGTKNLPALKRLRLVNVGYESEESLPSLISGCPVLEELIVERMAMVCLDVISPTLIRLVADLDYVMAIGFVLPVLRYLRLRVGKALCILAVNLDSLDEADIHLSEGKCNFSSDVVSFVLKLRNVKSLTLSTGRMNISNDEYFWIISKADFDNLTELKLCGDWRFITSFVEIASNLRVLTFSCLKVNDDSVQNWMEPKQSSTCLISHLETVKLVDFEWSTKHEFDMVKYILRNAQVLKMMEIINTQPREEFDSNEKLKAFKKLESFERRSQACHLAFVWT